MIANNGLGSIRTKCQQQLCKDANNTVLIENNEVAPDWGCNPFSSYSIVFKKNRIASVIAEFLLTLGVNRS